MTKGYEIGITGSTKTKSGSIGGHFNMFSSEADSADLYLATIESEKGSQVDQLKPTTTHLLVFGLVVVAFVYAVK